MKIGGGGGANGTAKKCQPSSKKTPNTTTGPPWHAQQVYLSDPCFGEYISAYIHNSFLKPISNPLKAFLFLSTVC